IVYLPRVPCIGPLLGPSLLRLRAFQVSGAARASLDVRYECPFKTYEHPEDAANIRVLDRSPRQPASKRYKYFLPSKFCQTWLQLSEKLQDTMRRLKEYPKNSFGRQHYLFFDSHGISPDTRSKVQYIEDEELAFVMGRYRDNHDFLHTLSGLPISVVSELGLKWFEFKQTGLPMTLLGSTFGPLALPATDFRDFYKAYKPWAEFAANRCAFFMNFEFESLLEQDIDKVRRLMNFTPYKCVGPLKVDLKCLSVLREETGLSLQLCRQALQASGNDLEAARIQLSKLAGSKADKKLASGSALQEGSIGMYEGEAGAVVLVKLLCTTDFVARGAHFSDLASKIMQAVYSDSERIHDRITDLIREKVGVLQENIVCNDFILCKPDSGNITGSYLHNKTINGLGTIGAVIEMAGIESGKQPCQSLANKVARHVAGMGPSSMDNLLSQQYLFAPDGSTVHDYLTSQACRIVRYYRMSIK
ncbi:hypothetical protein PSACC_02227, partial [Paramicrosporidium saccamoebae]